MLADWRAYLEFSAIFISYNFACFSLGQFVSSLSTNPLISMTLRASPRPRKLACAPATLMPHT